MIKNKIEKLIERHGRSTLTESKVVQALLLILTEVDEMTCITSLFNALPAKLQLAICSRLDELQSSDFNWQPFMVGEGFSEAELVRIKNQLRFIQGTLCEKS